MCEKWGNQYANGALPLKCEWIQRWRRDVWRFGVQRRRWRRPERRGKKTERCRNRNASTKRSKVGSPFEEKSLNCQVSQHCVVLNICMCVRQNYARQWGAACGPKPPAFISMSTDQRRWWIQRRTSTRRLAPPVDMNLLMRRCRRMASVTVVNSGWRLVLLQRISPVLQ